jgi:hypothetical protein
MSQKRHLHGQVTMKSRYFAPVKRCISAVRPLPGVHSPFMVQIDSQGLSNEELRRVDADKKAVSCSTERVTGQDMGAKVMQHTRQEKFH